MRSGGVGPAHVLRDEDPAHATVEPIWNASGCAMSSGTFCLSSARGQPRGEPGCSTSKRDRSHLQREPDHQAATDDGQGQPMPAVALRRHGDSEGCRAQDPHRHQRDEQSRPGPRSAAGNRWRDYAPHPSSRAASMGSRPTTRTVTSTLSSGPPIACLNATIAPRCTILHSHNVAEASSKLHVCQPLGRVSSVVFPYSAQPGLVAPVAHGEKTTSIHGSPSARTLTLWTNPGRRLASNRGLAVHVCQGRPHATAALSDEVVERG